MLGRDIYTGFWRDFSGLTVYIFSNLENRKTIE